MLDLYRAPKPEHDMWNLLAMAALRGDGLRPKLKQLLDRLRADPYADTFVRLMAWSNPGLIRNPKLLL